MRRLLLLLFAASWAAAAHSDPSYPYPFETEKDRAPLVHTGGSVLIRGARILTAVHGAIPSADLLVQNGKIARIGSRLEAPAGTAVIEAKGMVLTPGIIDAHSHRASDGTNEGAESITAEVRIRDVLNMNALNVWQALASGHTSALILHGSANTIGGQSLAVKYKHGRPASEAPIPDAPRMIKWALGENVTKKSDTGSTRFPRTRMGVEAVIRRAFAEAQAYRKAWADWEADKSKAKPRRDLRLQTLVDILDRKIWVQCHCYRSDEMLMLVRLSQEYGFKIGALQHALEAYKIAPELAKAGVGVSIFVDNWSFKVEGYDAIPWNAAICRKAGVNVSINTDGLGGTTALNYDAAKVMRFGGLSEDEALQMLTINPARQLGIDHRTGSIEAGKDADLVLWSGHPFSPYSKCMMTLIEGEVYFQRRDAFGVDALAPVSQTLPKKLNKGEARPLRRSDRYAIVGAEVHPVSGPVIPGATVLVEKGRIAAVGRDLPVPVGSAVVQGRGLRVYPGFFDGYSTLGLAEIGPVPAMVDSSELGQVQPDLDAATALWVESAHFGPALYAGVTTAFTAPAFGAISGQGAVISTDGRTTEQLALRRKAALMVNLGGGRPNFSFDACTDSFTTKQLLGLGTGSEDDDLTFDQREASFDLLGGGRPVLKGLGAPEEEEEEDYGAAGAKIEEAYAYFGQGLRPGDRGFDPQLEAMRPFLLEKRLMVISVGNAASVRKAAAFVKKHRLNAAFRGGSGAWKEAALLARLGIPVILNPAGESTLFANGPESPWDPYDTPYAAAGRLVKAGVKIAFGSGGGADVMNLVNRVGQDCAYGLSREDAVKALTLWPAQIFGVEKELGSLEAGKRATFVVTDGDPFEFTTTFRYVFIDGRPRELASRHTMLRDKYLARLKE